MRTFFSALCVVWFAPVFGTFFGVCPRKEPPPGVVVVSPGSELVLTCSGKVFVDGVKVESSSQIRTAGVTHSTVNSISHNAVLQKQHISVNWESEGHIISTTSSSSVSQPSRAKSDWEDGHKDKPEDEFDEEETGETTAKFNIQWKFSTKNVQWNREGSTLSLSRVRMSDSGRYSCHHGNTERFSTRVIVADEAPETPILSCYKKSPSSKIRCEWTPQTPVHKGTSCSLLIRKSLTDRFVSKPCSYSIRHSRCWCALDHNEDEKRLWHQAILCVSSIISNTTSELLSFKPLQIVKPDAPYNVSVQPRAGLNGPLLITWKPPYSWKFKDLFYGLIYEIRYKPLMSKHFQNITIDARTRHTITDAKAGLKYEVQVRAKSEYEGQWSDWSAPQYGCSWAEVSKEDLSTTPFPYSYSEGSGEEDPTEDYSMSTASPQVLSHHYLWMMITVSVGLSLAILVVYIIRYKDKCMSKLQSLGVLAQCSDSVHPRHAPAPADIAPAVAERHALLNKTRPPNAVKERSEQELRSGGEMIEATNLQNTSYFLVQSKI